jgi:hypothetical protein
MFPVAPTRTTGAHPIATIVLPSRHASGPTTRGPASLVKAATVVAPSTRRLLSTRGHDVNVEQHNELTLRGAQVTGTNGRIGGQIDFRVGTPTVSRYKCREAPCLQDLRLGMPWLRATRIVTSVAVLSLAPPRRVEFIARSN